MKIKKSFLTVALTAMAFGFASCSSDDDVVNNVTPDTGENLYARIQLQLPTTSRSETVDYTDPTNSSDGYEIGKDYENQVNDVIVILATKDANGKYQKACVSQTGAIPAVGSTADRPTFTVVFDDKTILNYAGQDIYLFAVCNANANGITPETLNSASFEETILSITNADRNTGIWKKGNFLMANAGNRVLGSKTLPAREVLQTAYNAPEKALDLGTVDVARVVSRFDFKCVNEDNTYAINDINTADEIAKIKFVGMSPINIAKNYYLFPSVSKDGKGYTNGGTNEWTLCGFETVSNYVVSPNWAEKAANPLTADFLAKYCNSTSIAAGFKFDNLTYDTFDLLSEDDNHPNWGDDYVDKHPGFDIDGFKIWRYVTENTLPTLESQKKGITTGVAFKAEIVSASEGSLLGAAMQSGNAIYSYNGIIYGNVEMLRQTVATLAEGNTLRTMFEAAFGADKLTYARDENGLITDDGNGNAEFVNTISDGDMTTNVYNGKTIFKIFRPTVENDTPHYYIYYTYYNRHNDNGNPTQMGSMEFATVRNNIYKLYINSVSEFGHTADPADDPDPEEEDEDDEEPKVYLKVSCKVMPWMVRINGIDF